MAPSDIPETANPSQGGDAKPWVRVRRIARLPKGSSTMRHPSRCAAILAVAILTSSVHAGETSLANNLRSQDPIVQAVKKTIKGVVAIRVARPGEKDMIGSGVIVDDQGVIVTNR